MKKQTTLKAIMKKNPHLYKHFSKMKEMDENQSFRENIIISLYFKIRNHHDLIKNNKINLMEFTNFEKMDDLISDLIRKSAINKFISGFLSNKYKKFMNNESLELFTQIYDLKLKKENLNNSFKKIARVHNNNDLISFLTQIILSHSNFNMQSILKKIKNLSLNVDIVSIDHEKKSLILRINDYKASKILGSPTWCISYSKNYFNHYTNKRGAYGLKASQYFVFNFAKEESNPFSLMGVTVSKNHFIFAADKRDFAMPERAPICQKISRLHNEWVDDSFLLKHFLKFVKGDKMDDLNHLIDCLSSVNFSKLSIEDFVLLSSRLDDFSSKSMKKRAQTFFQKVITQKYSANDILDSTIIDLIQTKYPKISQILNKAGYQIKSVIYSKQ